MKYMMFVPWAKGSPSTFGAESTGGRKNPRMNWAESADDKEFTIVYRDDENPDAFNFSDGGSSVQIYVRGHGFSGGDCIMPENKANHPEAVKFDELCEMLICRGLQTGFLGKIKFYNCHSADPGKEGSLSFACQCASYLRTKGYKNATYYGYTDWIAGTYKENAEMGNHKWRTPVTATTPDATKYRTSANQYRLEPGTDIWKRKTVVEIEQQELKKQRGTQVL